jgi:hypothetical protein
MSSVGEKAKAAMERVKELMANGGKIQVLLPTASRQSEPEEMFGYHPIDPAIGGMLIALHRHTEDVQLGLGVPEVRLRVDKSRATNGFLHFDYGRIERRIMANLGFKEPQ